MAQVQKQKRMNDDEQSIDEWSWFEDDHGDMWITRRTYIAESKEDEKA